MNIIQQYELFYISYDELLEEIWEYGQQVINQVGLDCFTFYVEASAGYHSFYYCIAPYEES